MTLDSQDEAALRAALKMIGPDKLRQVLVDLCPAKITTESALKDSSDGLARISAMRAGWEGCVESLIELAASKKNEPPVADFRDMSG